MIKRLTIVATLVLTLLSASVLGASAQAAPALSLPPGIAAQAQPLLDAMMAHMQQMGMSQADMQFMMADMQTLADQLPPGIFLQVLQLMPQLDMAGMMAFHQAVEQGNLLQQPPGQVLRFARSLLAG